MLTHERGEGVEKSVRHAYKREGGWHIQVRRKKEAILDAFCNNFRCKVLLSYFVALAVTPIALLHKIFAVIIVMSLKWSTIFSSMELLVVYSKKIQLEKGVRWERVRKKWWGFVARVHVCAMEGGRGWYYRHFGAYVLNARPHWLNGVWVKCSQSKDITTS